MSTTIAIHPHHEGLPGLAHGGYTGGLLAEVLGADTAEVRLRRPIPLGRPLEVRREAGRVLLADAETVIAEAREAQLALYVPPPVSLAAAEAAARRFPGHHEHPFPGCVTCGTARADGLRIFPGPVPGRRLVAAPWTPVTAGVETVWEALDCPQLWALMIHAPEGSEDRVVTARMTTTVVRPVEPGVPHVVIAWPVGREDGRWVAGAAIYGPDGELRAAGRQDAAIVTGWGVPLRTPAWRTDRFDVLPTAALT